MVELLAGDCVDGLVGAAVVAALPMKSPATPENPEPSGPRRLGPGSATSIWATGTLAMPVGVDFPLRGDGAPTLTERTEDMPRA